MEPKIRDDDKILIVSPHQDDESIGCGGLLSKYGKQCDVLLLANGKYSLNGYSINTIVDIRNKEFISATKIAKVNEIFMLNIENEHIKDNQKKIIQFDITLYKYIFVPNRYENHADHCCVLKIFKKMKRKQKSKAKIFEYEVWTPLRYPTWILDISDYIDTKKEMIIQYESQITDRDYVNSTLGLNSYRGMLIKKKYAEAYCDSLYDSFLRKLYELLPNSIKNIVKNILF